ncbi:MAG: DUF3526 domain-containing protein [Pseudomonadota bacterium]
MSALQSLGRELKFLFRQPAALAVIATVTLLATFAVWSGLQEADQQRATIERLLLADAEDRAAALAKESDYGGAAYYSFHLTYDPPPPLMFAALGERDVFPWKHRVRMLALEGQIYESDVGNAELAQAGRFDFALIISVLAPLFLIVLLHDQRASERVAGRHDLLVATAGTDSAPWRTRAAVRVGLLSLGLLVPFVMGAAISGAGAQLILSVLLVAILQILFWSVICLWAAARSFTGPAIASCLLAFWMLTTFVIPAIGEATINSAIPTPEGGDIMLTQRETVNDAWDLPKEETMEVFLEEHPEWIGDADIVNAFEWKWYYAFQQVGDQSVADLSEQRRRAILERDQAAGWLAFLSPSALTERALTRAAKTDVKAAMAYQDRVREFHASLREFFYPLLFEDNEYAESVFSNMPEYNPNS